MDVNPYNVLNHVLRAIPSSHVKVTITIQQTAEHDNCLLLYHPFELHAEQRVDRSLDHCIAQNDEIQTTRRTFSANLNPIALRG